MRSYVVPAGLVVLALIVWLALHPPRFWLNFTKQVAMTPEVGARLVEEYGCRDCHRIGGVGALKAPALDPVVLHHREDDPALVTLRLWLRNPKAVRPNTAMPNFHLSDSEIEAILLYLQAQSMDVQAQ
ncbi:cytochrome c [Litorilinea aerophila]|nr:c-type cytochrome [Litorilinea aerophila]MCC9074944.1 cytochrome c [Litorilinea aerophila]OUC07086.1 hypothetical protein RY27_17030 [Litorilinea aerophila]GIV76930.1 MAG: hypothetical protein KatS3mg050_1324 [Litorilinea sp.]